MKLVNACHADEYKQTKVCITYDKMFSVLRLYERFVTYSVDLNRIPFLSEILGHQKLMRMIELNKAITLFSQIGSKVIHNCIHRNYLSCKFPTRN